MTENIPAFRRPDIPVVGAASDKKKEAEAERVQSNFLDSRGKINSTFAERLRMLEYPKHDFERAAIKDSNALLNQVLEELDLPAFDVPESNIYSVPRSLYENMEGDPDDNDGIALIQEQVIVLNSENLDHPYARIGIILHEMIHLKGFVSLEADGKETTIRRAGLEAYSSLKKSREYSRVVRQFIGLNEAVVSELEKRLFKQVIAKNPFLSKEKVELSNSKSLELRNKIATQKKLAEDELLYAIPDKSSADNSYGRWRTFAYRPQREVLQYILGTIQRAYPTEFPHTDDVFRLFLKAHFGGHLTELARVIEDTFGQESFGRIGEMTGKDPESAYRVLAFLKKRTPLEIKR